MRQWRTFSVRVVSLVRGRGKCYRPAVDNTLVITEGPEEPEFNKQMAQYRRNGEWLTEHGAGIFPRFRGQYIAVAGGEIFVADDAWEARRLAKKQHPDDEPFVQYIPRERYERIYASGRPLASVR